MWDASAHHRFHEMRRFFLPSKQTSFNFHSAFIFSASLADVEFNLAADRPAQREASALRDEGETFTGCFTFHSETLFSCVNRDHRRRSREQELLYIYQPTQILPHSTVHPRPSLAECLQYTPAPAPPTTLLLPMSLCLPHNEAYPPPHSTVSSSAPGAHTCVRAPGGLQCYTGCLLLDGSKTSNPSWKTFTLSPVLSLMRSVVSVSH